MAYDALKETTPSRSSKEYLKILTLAAEQGEVQVDEALRASFLSPNFAYYLFSSTKIASKALSLRFSGKCSPPSSHMISPAFDFGSSVFPSGRLNLKWASVKKTATPFGCPCSTDLS